MKKPGKSIKRETVIGLADMTPTDFYPVLLAKKPIVTCEGFPKRASYSHQRGCITISPTVPESEREGEITYVTAFARKTYPAR